MTPRDPPPGGPLVVQVATPAWAMAPRRRAAAAIPARMAQLYTHPTSGMPRAGQVPTLGDRGRIRAWRPHREDEHRGCEPDDASDERLPGARGEQRGGMLAVDRERHDECVGVGAAGDVVAL